MWDESLPKVEIFQLMGAVYRYPSSDWGEISLGQADRWASRSCEISRESVQWVALAERRKCWLSVLWEKKTYTCRLPLHVTSR